MTPGWSVNILERAVSIILVAAGFLISMLFRVFMIAILLIPFFGLMQHARREDGVAKVRGSHIGVDGVGKVRGSPCSCIFS